MSKVGKYIINDRYFGFNRINGEILEFDSMHELDMYTERINNQVLNLNYYDEKEITITIELNNVCNLNCLYCYQRKKNTREEIRKETLKSVIEYLRKVFINKSIKTLNLRFIGGEPLLSEELLINCHSMVSSLCRNKGIVLNVHIDTNGTYPLNRIFSIIKTPEIVISLSCINDHNRYRSDSFEQIICNLRSLTSKEHRNIVLRYNCNKQNIDSFEQFVRFIRQDFPSIGGIIPARIDFSGTSFAACEISKKDYVQWNSTTAINILIENKYPIVYAPRYGIGKCQGYEKYSCKVYSDGAVTVCDAMYHEESKVSIRELSQDISLIVEKYKDIKDYSVLQDKKCKECEYVVQCGGELFCRSENCDFYSEYNENGFITTYIENVLKGRGEYFKNMVSSD